MTTESIGNDPGVVTTVTGGDIGDATSAYSYFNMGFEDWRYATIAFPTVTATTLTLEATTDSLCPGTSYTDAAASWTDVTTALTGAASATTSGAWIIDTNVAFPRMRVKRLTTNATNALSLKIIRSR